MMSGLDSPPFERTQAATLASRLAERGTCCSWWPEPDRSARPRKTTLVGQVLGHFDLPSLFISADEPTLRDAAWLAAQWERARLVTSEGGKAGA